jgi:hypothetical protein
MIVNGELYNHGQYILVRWQINRPHLKYCMEYNEAFMSSVYVFLSRDEHSLRHRSGHAFFADVSAAASTCHSSPRGAVYEYALLHTSSSLGA